MSAILALDIGAKRIGVAISDESKSIAMPLDVMDAKRVGNDYSLIKELCKKKNVERIIIGHPLNMDGSKGPAARKVGEIAKQLEQDMEIPVELWDERLSTEMVERSLIRDDVSRQKRKKLVDKLAAQVILQSYLDVEPVRKREGKVN